jgi:S-DNA-T family DNA segregation ATPase FtsK/SpoIIIE
VCVNSDPDFSEIERSKKFFAVSAESIAATEEIIAFRKQPVIYDPRCTAKCLEENNGQNTRSPADCEGYELPLIDLLDAVDLANSEAVEPTELRAIQDVVIKTLAQFGIEVSAGDITRGPTITRYELYPAKGVRVDSILYLERDLTRAVGAERIDIQAPIPGKETVGIEIANSKRQRVTLRELFESDDFCNSKARIPIALGKDMYGKTIVADLAAMRSAAARLGADPRLIEPRVPVDLVVDHSVMVDQA